MRARGKFFELTDRFGPRQRVPASASDPASGPRASALPSPSVLPTLIISVPKRIVRSAVRRNLIKRILRESWRHSAVSRVAVRPDGPLGKRWMLKLHDNPFRAIPADRLRRHTIREEADMLLSRIPAPRGQTEGHRAHE